MNIHPSKAETILLAMEAEMERQGFKVVPIEPTEAMIKAGVDCYNRDECTCAYSPTTCQECREEFSVRWAEVLEASEAT